MRLNRKHNHLEEFIRIHVESVIFYNFIQGFNLLTPSKLLVTLQIDILQNCCYFCSQEEMHSVLIAISRNVDTFTVWHYMSDIFLNSFNLLFIKEDLIQINVRSIP